MQRKTPPFSGVNHNLFFAGFAFKHCTAEYTTVRRFLCFKRNLTATTICQTPTVIKKTPKQIRKTLLSVRAAKNAPPTAHNDAGTTIHPMCFGLTNLFLACNLNATTHIGKKLIRFIACTVFCGISKKDMRGTNTVPPPIPIPPIMPDKNPNNINKKICIFL